MPLSVNQLPGNSCTIPAFTETLRLQGDKQESRHEPDAQVFPRKDFDLLVNAFAGNWHGSEPSVGRWGRRPNRGSSAPRDVADGEISAGAGCHDRKTDNRDASLVVLQRKKV